jgi:hypothetical protein
MNRGQHERPAGCQHVLFGEDQPCDALSMAPQLAFLAHAGHVGARLANRAQRAAIFGRQRAVELLGEVTQDATTWSER